MKLFEDEQTEVERKLKVVCRYCNLSFTPGPFECPYQYDAELGVHVAQCNKCRAARLG